MMDKIMKKQMEHMGMTSYYLWKYTGVGYATINTVLNGERRLEALKSANYQSIMRALFSRTEKELLDYTAAEGWEEYRKAWKETLKHALDQQDAKIYRSGAPYTDESGNPQNLPIHVQIQWGEVRMKRNTIWLNQLNTFDGDLYRSLNNKGQRDKKELIKEYLNRMV